MADRNGYIGRAPGDSSVIIARQTNQPTGVTTTFTFSSGYDVGYLDVYVNGSKLINALDYTATDTSTVSLTVAAVDGDVVEFVAYKAFNLSHVASSAPGDLNVTGDLIAGGGTFSGDISAVGGSLSGDLSVSGELSVTGHTTSSTGYYSGIVTASAFYGDGSTLTGVANTDRINAESITVSGISTFTGNLNAGNVSASSSVTAAQFYGGGAGLTGLDIPVGFTELDATLFN